MAQPMDESERRVVSLDIDHRLKLEFDGANDMSDAGSPPSREIDDAVPPTDWRSDLEPSAIALIRRLFHAGFYCRFVEDDGLGEADMFSHFLEHGLAANLPPGPFFAPEYCRHGLISAGLGEASDRPVLLRWFDAGGLDSDPPTKLFDAAYYMQRYQDVSDAGAKPFFHYVSHGHNEGRAPCRQLEALVNILNQNRRLGLPPVLLADFLALMPQGCESRIMDYPLVPLVGDFFSAEFYSAQAGDLQGADKLDPLSHYISVGVFEGCRPHVLFNSQYYLSALHKSELAGGFPVKGKIDPFLHWLFIGRERRIVPTPLFDEEYYGNYADMRVYDGWTFDHYFRHGLRELQRRPSMVFDASHYRKQVPTIRCAEHLLDYVLHGEPAGASPAPGVNIAAVEQPDHLKSSTRIETVAILIADKLARLNSPPLMAQIEYAARIEPKVLRSYGTRDVQWPPLKHAVADRVENARAVRQALPVTHCDTLVLIPHCRLSGAARVAGHLCAALRAIYPSDSMLVVHTDLSEFQERDWFGDATIFDLASLVRSADELTRIEILLDVIRGLRPRRVVNVNSRLAWSTLRKYGRQLSQFTSVVSYLFTWDLDAKGGKGGYPVEFFCPTFDAHSAVLVDNSSLAQELVERYCLPSVVRDKLRLLHTPFEAPDVSFAGLFEQRRRSARPMRCFWCGRFDRQKRFDIVLEVARQLGELEIWAWGTNVLDSTPDFTGVPENVRLQGVYERFDDLPIEAFDFFLYTSEWDGLPTVLIDAGARGINTVASAVGGTVDLISERTAWPVVHVTDPQAYVSAIRAMWADPAEVTRRAGEFRRLTRELCDFDTYCAALKSALERRP